MTDDIDLESVDDVAKHIRSLRNQIAGAHERIGQLEETIEDQQETIDRLNSEVSVTKASVPTQSKNKLENVLAVIKHAYDKKNGGRAGVKMDSGEVTAVIDGSKQTALRLIDDIAEKCDFAQSENPGGPKPKVLKIRMDESPEDRRERVAEIYSG